ncbi:MAG: DUF6913 domain-containing protein [Bacteroidota bacterium]
MKKRIREYILKKACKQEIRSRSVSNLYDAKTIGILFDATSKDDFGKVKKLLNSLTEKGLKIFIIGFVNSKEVPDVYLIRKGFNFFCRKDLNWYGKPVVPFVDEFIKKEFDILINLDLNNTYPLHYIECLSKAHFKAGRMFPGNEDHDIMIDINLEPTLDFLISQIIHYLAEINKKEPSHSYY